MNTNEQFALTPLESDDMDSVQSVINELKITRARLMIMCNRAVMARKNSLVNWLIRRITALDSLFPTAQNGEYTAAMLEILRESPGETATSVAVDHAIPADWSHHVSRITGRTMVTGIGWLYSNRHRLGTPICYTPIGAEILHDFYTKCDDNKE